MRRISRILSILLISLSLMGLTTIPQSYTIRVGVYENAPKIYTTADGNAGGFWSEIIKYIARKEGWQIIWVNGTWEEGLQRLESNEIDILPDVGWTTERGEKFAFNSESILTSWARIYTPNGQRIETILDLEGKTVAGLNGSLNFDGPEGIKELATKFDVHCDFIGMRSYTEVFEALQKNDVDAGVTNKDFGDLNEIQYNVSRTPIIIQPTQIRFALTKDADLTPYLVKTIDHDIQQLKADPKSIYYQALDTFFGEKPVEITPAWVNTLLLVTGGFIFFLVAVIVTSRMEVRRQTKKLAASELRYRTLLENYPDLLFRISRDGIFLDYHTSTENDLIAPPREFLGKKAVDVLPPNLAEQTMEKVRLAINTRQIQVLEYVLDIDGKQRDYEARYSAIGDTEVIAIIRNISASKQAERNLRESEERYHTLARVSPVGIFRTDINGMTTYVNPTWSIISGLAPEEAMGEGWLKSVHPEDRDLIQTNWETSASKKNSSQADYRFIKPDGSITYVIGQAVPELNSENQVVGYVGTITDITERVEANAALQRSREAEKTALDIKETIQAANLALVQSLDLKTVLNSLFNYLSQIVHYDRARVILIQPDGKLGIALSSGYSPQSDIRVSEILNTNYPQNPLVQELLIKHRPYVVDDTNRFPDWEKIAGEGHGKSWIGIPLIAGGQVLGFFSLDNDEKAFFTHEYQSLAESLAAQAAVAIQNAGLHERVLRHADELEARVTERTVELAKRVSEVEALNKSMQDLNTSLQDAVRKAESADRLKSAFLATMSHELRTPLNSIIGFTGILLQKMVGPLSDEQEKQLGMVQSSARHLLELINDVLDISKIEADQVVIVNEEFNIGESIRRCLDRVRPLANNKGLELTADLSQADMVVSSDRRRVEQILLNLMNNAIKFTEHGSVKVDCRPETDFLRISVIDTGIGIKTEDRQKLFKPFQQIDSGITRQYEGTGLGLSICQRLVKLLGGEINVQSEPGTGSTFSFTLPVKRNEK